MKCSGVAPCTRCNKRSLPCEFPEGSELRDSGPVETGPSQTYEDRPNAISSADELQPAMVSATREQQKSSGALAPGQQHSTEAYAFMEQPIQPVDLLPHETTTHMISTLNWISPTMEFDLTEFNYAPIGTGEQYWNPPNDMNASASQASPMIQTIRPVDDVQSHQTPQSFPDSNDAETPGTAYVDNRGARRPRNGRYANRIFDEEESHSSLAVPRNCPDVSMIAPEPEGFSLAVPLLPDLYAQEHAGTQPHTFTLEQYRTMREAFQDLCLTPSSASHNGPFFSQGPTELPSISIFTHLLSLYRRHFDPKVLPLIHFDASMGQSHHWVIKLAMSVIGSQYMDAEYTELTVALHEFLRRALRQRGALFSNGDLSEKSLALVQSKLLNYIGIAYCGSTRLEACRVSILDDLVSEYKSLYRTQLTTLQGEVTFQDRQRWIFVESARRLYHAIWMLEVMSRHHFGTQATLLLDFASTALPCKEAIWQSEANQTLVPTKPYTLEKALRVLYVEKRLLRDMGDFARVLVIHGLYCQTWDVARSLNRPLLRWTPSAEKGNAESHELTGPPWLPSIPLYNHWRNATCDCLDVLHWIANSDIAKTGTENTTVLHLHFSRIALLAPYELIRNFAELVASENWDGHEFQERCHEVRRWIKDDQYKARLALVHCGVFFWHVRRYSTDAFYEPVKVFLVTLVVWAYGSLCPPQQRTSSHKRPDDDQDWSSDLEDISSIRLDRPTDDELVQIFIKRGRSMNATIMGVGNITAPHGPVRMLREGSKLLETLSRWPIRRRYLQTLARLVSVCSQSERWLQTTSNPERTSQSISSR